MRMCGLQLVFFQPGATQRLMLTIMDTLRADLHRDTAGKVHIHLPWANPRRGRISLSRRMRDAVQTIELNRMYPRFLHRVLHPCVQHEQIMGSSLFMVVASSRSVDCVKDSLVCCSSSQRCSSSRTLACVDGGQIAVRMDCWDPRQWHGTWGCQLDTRLWRVSKTGRDNSGNLGLLNRHESTEGHKWLENVCKKHVVPDMLGQVSSSLWV